MTSSMSILPASTAPASSSVALEIAAPTPIATHVSVTPSENWAKTHRRPLIIVGVVVLTGILLTAALLYYFLSYVPNHNGSSSGPVYNQKEFQLWMTNHDITYSSTDAQTAAFSNWIANMQAVHAANVANTGVTYALGPYADLTQEQYQSQILTLNLASRTVSPTTAPPTTQPPVTAAGTLNWATNPAMVSPVKNQGQCGDCWAFSTAEAFEVAYNVAYQPTSSITLSAQQITSCDTNDSGCNGGDPVNVYQHYLSPTSGTKLTTEANYPFTSGNSGSTGTCNNNAAATGFVQLTSWSYAVNPTTTWTQAAEDKLIQALQTSPVSICIDASPWQNYAGGVLSNTAGGCTSNQNDVDHAVQLVGYTPTYWIVKNQWGSSWGSKGYIYLARGANTCCILCEATQVTVKSTQSGATTAAPTTATTTKTSTAAATTAATTAAQTTTAAGQSTASGQTTTKATTTTTRATATTKKTTTTQAPATLDPYWWYYYFLEHGSN